MKGIVSTFRQLNIGEKVIVSIRMGVIFWIFTDIYVLCVNCPTRFTPAALAFYVLITCIVLPFGERSFFAQKRFLLSFLDVLAASLVFLSVNNPSHLGPFLFYVAVVWSVRFMTIPRAALFIVAAFLVYAAVNWMKGIISFSLVKHLMAMVGMGVYTSLFAGTLAESERERHKRELLLKELKNSFQEQTAAARELEKMNAELKRHTTALEEYQAELVRRNQELGLLTEVLKTTTATLDPTGLLQHTLIKTIELFGVDSAFIILLNDSDMHNPEVAACQGISTEDSLTLGRKILPVLVETKQVLVWRYGATPPLAGTQNFLLNAGITGFLATPLMIQGKVHGMMALTNYNYQDVAQEQEFFHIVSSQVSLALEKAMMYEYMKKQAITDGLTSLYNVRHFKDRLREELTKIERKNSFLSLLMIDIDWFKDYNDTHGHQAGDTLLCQVARVLMENVREGDLVARYGGEEFTVILPEATHSEAFALADRLRCRFKDAQADGVQSDSKVTLSIGVATYPDHALTVKGLVEYADRAMYRAKALGKDKVCSITELIENPKSE